MNFKIMGVNPSHGVADIGTHTPPPTHTHTLTHTLVRKPISDAGGEGGRGEGGGGGGVGEGSGKDYLCTGNGLQNIRRRPTTIKRKGLPNVG